MLRTPFARVATAISLAVGLVAVPVAAGTLSAASAAKPKPILGPDVSHYQHPNGKAINWTKVAKTGVTFAISKATEGTDYTDPYFASDYAAEHTAGLVHGSYHFAHPELPIPSTAMAQARYFANTVGAVKTTETLPPALDLEQTGGLTPGQLVTWAQDFLLDMRSLTGRTPMLYTYPNFWTTDLKDASAFARYPLWMAEYGTSTAPVADVWQYTDNAHIKGISDAADESKFLGTTGFPWATLSNGTIATPWKAAAPKAPVSLSASSAADEVGATVSWLPGDAGTSQVTGYTVTASPGGKTYPVGPGTFSTTIGNLNPATTYTFTVTATNAIGTSPATEPSNPVTPTIPTVLNASLRKSLKYGGAMPLQASLERADNHKALVNKQVLVFRRLSPSGPWRQVSKMHTDSSGKVSTTLHPTKSGELEAVFPGGNGVARASIFANYAVVPTVTAALSTTTVKHGKHATVTMTGSASPFVARTQVLRESLVNGRWVVLASSRLGAKGRFRFTIHTTTAATMTYRVVVEAAGGRSAGASGRMHLAIT